MKEYHQLTRWQRVRRLLRRLRLWPKEKPARFQATLTIGTLPHGHPYVLPIVFKKPTTSPSPGAKVHS